MATSGSYNFTNNSREACELALQEIGKAGIGKTIPNEDMTLAHKVLNMMLKTWSVDGLHLWKQEEGVLYLTQYTAKYSLGNASTDARTTLKDEETITQLNGALAASATAVTVDSTTGMTVGDAIGIVLSDKTLHWTTVATIPSSTTLTLTVGVTGAASDNAYVFSYTNRIYKPMRINTCRLAYGSSAGLATAYTERVLSPLPYRIYQEMPSKNSNSSAPVLYTYLPKNTTGDFYVWPRPSDCSYRIEFTFTRAIQDLDSQTDDFDLPAEWMETVVANLAVRLAKYFGLGAKIKELSPLADSLYTVLMRGDSERLYIDLTPNMGDY